MSNSRKLSRIQKRRTSDYFNTMKNLKPKDKELMLRHVENLFFKIENDLVTIDDQMQILKGMLVSLHNLKQTY